MIIAKNTLVVFNTPHSRLYAASNGAVAVTTKEYNSDTDRSIYVKWVRTPLAAEQRDGGYDVTDFLITDTVIKTKKLLTIKGIQ